MDHLLDPNPGAPVDRQSSETYQVPEESHLTSQTASFAYKNDEIELFSEGALMKNKRSPGPFKLVTAEPRSTDIDCGSMSEDSRSSDGIHEFSMPGSFV